VEMKTTILSKNEGSWAEERTRVRRTEPRICAIPLSRIELARRDVLSLGRCAFLHDSRTTSVLHSCSLLENRQTVRFDRGEINSLAHTLKIKGVPRRRSREKWYGRRRDETLFMKMVLIDGWVSAQLSLHAALEREPKKEASN